MGIDELKDVIRFALKLGTAIASAKEDGKIGWTDAAAFVPALVALPAAITGVGDVMDEIRDIDENEKTELHQMVRDEFEIPGDQVEQVVEQAFLVALEIVTLVNMV